MSVNLSLVEAVLRLRTLEKETDEARRDVALLLDQAAETQPVTALSRLTNIKRTTIYWLIHKYNPESK